MKYLIPILLTLFFSVNTLADTAAPIVENVNGCVQHILCDTETVTGVCTHPVTGDEVVLIGAGRSNITFYGLQSIGNYNCDIISSDRGHDDSGGVGHTVNSASITQVAPVLTIEGPLYAFWISCGTIATSVTVTSLICPGTN